MSYAKEVLDKECRLGSFVTVLQVSNWQPKKQIINQAKSNYILWWGCTVVVIYISALAFHTKKKNSISNIKQKNCFKQLEA